MPPKKKSRPKSPKKSSKRKASPRKSSSSDDEISEILRDPLIRSRRRWSNLSEKPRTTIIRYPSPAEPIIDNKWANIGNNERVRTLCRGGRLFNAPGVCSKCAGFPNPDDILFSHLAEETHKKRPSTNSEKSSSSSYSGSSDYVIDKIDDTRFKIRKIKPDLGMFRHLDGFNTTKKLNKFSSKRKRTSKVHTGKRGGKYIIKNGKKKYLPKK